MSLRSRDGIGNSWWETSKGLVFHATRVNIYYWSVENSRTGKLTNIDIAWLKLRGEIE